MKYKLINDNEKTINIKLTNDSGKEIFIPLDEENTDYKEYLEWTKASPKNVPEPADELIAEADNGE